METFREQQFYEFVDYCWDFYGPQGIYADTFDGSLTMQQLKAAVNLRIATVADFHADSIDRECVREILLFARDAQTLARKAMIG